MRKNQRTSYTRNRKNRYVVAKRDEHYRHKRRGGGIDTSERNDPISFLSHQIVWVACGIDGVTDIIKCTCGWEGTPAQFHNHCGAKPWTDDEIRKAFSSNMKKR